MKLLLRKSQKIPITPREFGRSHGQKVYEYKGKFYSQDVDSQNGGVWKFFISKKGGGLERLRTTNDYFKNHWEIMTNLELDRKILSSFGLKNFTTLSNLKSKIRYELGQDFNGKRRF